MPDLFLLTSADGAVLINKHIETIGLALRAATAGVFPDLDGDPNTVSVFVIAHNGGDNTPLIQIVGIASWSFNRWLKIKLWKKSLAFAWKNAASRISILSAAQDKIPIDKVQVWPMMPFGSWGLVSKIVSNLK